MSGKRYPDECKTEAVKQVVERGHSISSITTHSIYSMKNKYAQDMVKVTLWIDSVQPVRSDQAIQQGARFTTMIAAESFSCRDRPLVVRAQQRYYPVLPDHYRSSNIGHPTGSGHKRTPRPTGIFSTEWRFSPPTSHEGISAALCSGIA